jgi:hypothetical protein
VWSVGTRPSVTFAGVVREGWGHQGFFFFCLRDFLRPSILCGDVFFKNYPIWKRAKRGEDADAFGPAFCC